MPGRNPSLAQASWSKLAAGLIELIKIPCRSKDYFYSLTINRLFKVT